MLSIAVIVVMGELISKRLVFTANWIMTGLTFLSAVLTGRGSGGVGGEIEGEMGRSDKRGGEEKEGVKG